MRPKGKGWGQAHTGNSLGCTETGKWGTKQRAHSPCMPRQTPHPGRGRRPARSAAPRGRWGLGSGPQRLWRTAPRPRNADRRRRPPAVGGPGGSGRQGQNARGPELQLAPHPAHPHSSCRGDTLGEKVSIRGFLSSVGDASVKKTTYGKTPSLRGGQSSSTTSETQSP